MALFFFPLVSYSTVRVIQLLVIEDSLSAFQHTEILQPLRLISQETICKGCHLLMSHFNEHNTVAQQQLHLERLHKSQTLDHITKREKKANKASK